MTDPRNQMANPRKRKYRSDGTPTWGKPVIDGPGVWVSCVKGKERQSVGELYDLFESVAAEVWPTEGAGRVAEDIADCSDAEELDDDLPVEAQIAKELAAIKRPRKQQRFANCQTNTPCVVFISCKPPVDPVRLVTTHIENVQKTGVARTKYVHRFVPVSGSCTANLPEIRSLCQRVFPPFFAQQIEDDGPSQTYRYKIEIRTRNHNTVPRIDLIQEVAKCMPQNYLVDLNDAQVFVLIELFKSICGVSIVKDYYQLQKFNVMELANIKKAQGDDGTERVREKGKDIAVKEQELREVVRDTDDRV
ncbi:hypothetical protein SERLA73DRAFT_181559 [Serpula lacrymans var. lacrymans S7.3]|uniref:THUMP domain-containing protein n=2 Tax=Serpula lacrymans var. lacrymans TaxID=341189 RepID=F8PYA0_SERL3|nr:uncharacterized protein SERLADRAFT_467767 [Serpula lacrymans var. lacrymans S7.9]EGN98863.1 hypothetical protein SERLA73DRAFT_181559 [Serpula lacrymans var. lacrymans S7.3]EGO24443.1 hypothetical protein SERLADRAFT_467767 [Serpula lacrymans var. lacrymans S7.9]